MVNLKQQKYENEIAKTVPCGTDAGRFFPKVGYQPHRVAILVIFVWIGGLKFWNYEAEGIVPFVANSPFMSFFYDKPAPEYKEYKLKEGEFDEAKHRWHVENNTYGFSRGLAY